MKTGIELIADERKRQIDEEGYSIKYDVLMWKNHELINATLAYLCSIGSFSTEINPKEIWPWSPEVFKPKSDIENLVRAGALIAAEIDRIQNEENPRSHTKRSTG